MGEDINVIDKRNQREIGMEMLRIIAILLIIFHHFLLHGGFMQFVTNVNKQAYLAKLMSNVFPISINLFIIISGYFMINKKIKIKRIVVLWLEVLFYSVLFYFISLSFNYDKFSYKGFLRVLMPVLYEQYWFFSVYFLLMLLSPFLVAMLNNVTDKQYLFLVIGILVLTILVNNMKFLTVSINFGMGYSLIWFICAFIIGGFLRRTNISLKWWGYLLSIVFVVFIAFIKMYTKVFSYGGYSGIGAILTSIFVFLIFKNVKIKSTLLNRILSIISSATFGVYLIHDNNFIRSILYHKIFNIDKFYNHPFGTFIVLGFVIIVFIVCVVIDLVRQGLFKGVITIFKKVKDGKENKLYNNMNDSLNQNQDNN